MACIQDSWSSLSQVNSKNISQAFPVSVVGIQSKLAITKDKDTCYEFILNTTYSLVTPTDSIYSKITTINPQYVICNQTGKLLLIAQVGHQEKNVEVVPHGARMPHYWTDYKGKQRISFKFADV